MKLNAFVLPFAAENIFHNTGRHFYDYRTETTFNRRNYYTCRKYGQKPGTRHTHRPRYRDDDHGCIGDTTLIDPRLFEVDSSVDKVMHVQEP